jgi:5-methylcytosine-specific restriction protein A
MARLSLLTDPQAVRDALMEFERVGRDSFLHTLGFDKSRDYFLLDRGVLYDTKPVVAFAYGRQLGQRPLSNKDFSGGAVAAARALERLGFQVVTRAQLNPPRLGEPFLSRTEIYESFGGDRVAGVIKFPGEDVINVFSDAEGPYADDAPTLTDPFGYRGEGLNGPQRVESGGNALLERARVSGEPVRFWYKPLGEPFTWLSWAAVLGRAWVPGEGQDGQPRPELDWTMEAVAGTDASEWPAAVRQAMTEGANAVEDDPTAPEGLASATYAELVKRVNQRGQPKRPSGVVRVDYPRSAAARRAVLLRCAGKCESPRCTGMPAELNRRGEPILDIDHIRDLGLGGEDHPLNMVALCPNCHAIKTRGSRTARYRRELTSVAAAAHAREIARP